MGGQRPPPARGAEPSAPADLTVNELLLAYWRWAETYYVKGGKPTSEQATIKHALRFVRQLYGPTPAKDFGPLALKAVRQAMVDHTITRKVKVRDPETGEVRTEERVLRQGLARRFVNKQVQRIRRLFAWGVEEGLVPVTVHQALLRVRGLKKGKGQDRAGRTAVAPCLPVWNRAALARASHPTRPTRPWSLFSPPVFLS